MARTAKAIREAMTFHANGGDLLDWCFLALAKNRLHHADAAQRAAATARALKQKANTTVWEFAELELLLAELDAAMPPAWH